MLSELFLSNSCGYFEKSTNFVFISAYIYRYLTRTIMSPIENKRIAQNTLYMYVRMFVTMLVSLYTSRIILSTLGISDYGIFNVVSGVVVMFSFLNSAMSASTLRYLTIENGKNNFNEHNKVFQTSVSLHLIVAVIMFVLSETIGVWFINSQLTIPPQRLHAVNWVFQFSILSMIVSIISVPYNTEIISHEHFNFYAYISIVDVVLRLIIVFALQIFKFDKLILYSFFIFVVNFSIQFLYRYYCKKKFKEARYNFLYDKNLLKDMSVFAFWNLFGVFAGIGYNQGVNILLNVFFGTVINAARGISFQILSSVNQIVANFQTVVNPSIIKNYTTNYRQNAFNLVFSSSKFSYYLLLIFIFPIFFRADWVLSTWLKTVPEYTLIFTRLVLIDSLICSLSGPLQTLVQANGRIKVYQIIVSSILLLNLPLSYIVLKITAIPYFAFVIAIILSIFAFIFRLVILKKMENFPVWDYIKNVIIRVLIVTIIIIPVPYFLEKIIFNPTWLFIITFLSSTFGFILVIWLLGINNEERNIVKNFLGKHKIIR